MDRLLRFWLTSFVRIRDEIDHAKSQLESNRRSIIESESLLPVNNITRLIDQVNQVNKEMESLLKDSRIQLNDELKFPLNNLNVITEMRLTESIREILIRNISQNSITPLSTPNNKASEYLSGMITMMLEMLHTGIMDVLDVLREATVHGIDELNLLLDVSNQ